MGPEKNCNIVRNKLGKRRTGFSIFHDSTMPIKNDEIKQLKIQEKASKRKQKRGRRKNIFGRRSKE